MKQKMKDFANIVSGYAFRGAIEPNWIGKDLVLQAKNISSSEDIVSSEGLIPVDYPGESREPFLKKGDVLTVSRGTGKGSFRSSVFESECNNVFASSSLLIIRLFDKKVLPGYLSLYLNSDEGQGKLLETVSGSYIQAISRKRFEDLEIPIPPIEKQSVLIQVAENTIKQQKIREKQNQLNKEILNGIFTNITKS